MKKKWQAPDLEVLNVCMTMKGWHDDDDGHGGKDDNSDDGFDS